MNEEAVKGAIFASYEPFDSHRFPVADVQPVTESPALRLQLQPLCTLVD